MENGMDAPTGSVTCSLISLPQDTELLLEFLVDEDWPFHAGNSGAKEEVLKKIESGEFVGEGVQTFWVLDDHNQHVGLIKIFEMEDIGDGAPLFDLRVRASARKRGIGFQVVCWLIRYLFENWPELNRIEGTTRVDNLPMRKIFKKCGFAKEGHYRKAWGEKDAIHYAILREDWISGSVSPVNWDDEKDL